MRLLNRPVSALAQFWTWIWDFQELHEAAYYQMGRKSEVWWLVEQNLINLMNLTSTRTSQHSCELRIIVIDGPNTTYTLCCVWGSNYCRSFIFPLTFPSTGTHSRSAEIEEEFHHVILCCTWLRFKNSFSSNSQFCMLRYFSHVQERWRNRPFWRSGRTSQKKNTLKNCVNLFFLLSSYFPFSHQFWNETAIRCGHNNRTLKNNKKKTHNSQIFVKKSELNFTLLMSILYLCYVIFFRSSAHLGLGLGCYNEKKYLVSCSYNE